MDDYGGEIQNDLPIFIPSNVYETRGNEDPYHSVFCEIYVYDYFQNKKCVFKGLGKILVPPNDASGRIGNPENSEVFPKKMCVQRVQSTYANQLKKLSHSQHPNLFRESNVISVMSENLNDSIDKFDSIHNHDCVLNGDSEGLAEWHQPLTMPSDDIEHNFDKTHCRDSFNGFVEIEDFPDGTNISNQFIDSQSGEAQLETLNNINEGIEVTNRLDYEMLLPHSVVESSSYLSLPSEQSGHEGITDYANMYKGLFEQVEEVQDLTNDDIEKKGDFEEYLEEPSSFRSDDEPYFLTDISNLTHRTKRDSFSSNKSTDVTCEICKRKCRSINALNHHMLVHSEERPFVCEICKKAFKEQPTLRRHMWTHMDKQHQCDICEKYFVEKSSLRRHIGTIHADFKPGMRSFQNNTKQHFSCMKCGKVFKSQAKFTIHHGMHGNPNFECGICGKVYAGRSHLKIHQRIHTGEKPYICNICDMKFAFKHVLKSHQARIHQKIHKFKCNVCLLTFIKKSELSSHASCHMINMKKNKRNYVSRKNSKKHAAPVAKGKGGKKPALEVPMKAFTTLFKQLVDVVPEKYKSDEDMNIVIDKCNSSKDGLCKSPNTLTDQGKKNKECLECYKTFERMGDLKRHLISHIVENMNKKARDNNYSVPVYECEICYNITFKQVDKFKKHLREHAKLTLYQCQICDRAFGDSSNFSKHKKVHGESYLKCTICNRKFNTKRMMIAHMNYHRENKPKTCHHCKKLFHFDSNLRKHIKIAHLTKGKMTYRCEECGERFISVKLKWEHQWEIHQMRKVKADCHICNAQFRKISLLRAHIMREHTTLEPSTT